MKKILSMALIAISISTTAFSQFRYGVQVGGALSFAQFEQAGNDNLTNKARLGLVAGFVGDLPLGPISFRPEINFIQKGYRNDTTAGAGVEKISKARLNYLEVPLNFVYNIHAGSGKAFVGIGPNFGLGLSGKDKIETRTTTSGTLTTNETTNDIKFSGDNNTAANGNLTEYFKRFDFGGNLIAGYQCKMGLTIAAQFTLGLIDISRNLDVTSSNGVITIDDLTQKIHTLTLKVGYLFGGNSMKSKSTSTSSSSGTF